MTKTLIIQKKTEQGLLKLFKFLLESGRVNGIVTLKKINKDDSVAYTLVTNPDELTDCVPLYPLMPANAGKLLSRLTLKEKIAKPILAVVRPCELRAFIELVKREQGNLENLFFMSSTCGGVYPLQMATDGLIEKYLSHYWSAVRKGAIPVDLRSACKGCETFTSNTADLAIDLIGNDAIDKNCTIFLNTEKGEELVKGFTNGEIGEKNGENEILDTLKKGREAEKKKMFNMLDGKGPGGEGFIEIFGKCIGCHGCSKVCPICYCKLCGFESADFEYRPSTYETDFRIRGGVRVPPRTVFFHLGRLDHISISCVGCGMCEDVCPVDIPISVVFKKVGESVQTMFEYHPGENVEEDIPLITFKEEEFSEVEE